MWSTDHCLESMKSRKVRKWGGWRSLGKKNKAKNLKFVLLCDDSAPTKNLKFVSLFEVMFSLCDDSAPTMRSRKLTLYFYDEPFLGL